MSWSLITGRAGENYEQSLRVIERTTAATGVDRLARFQPSQLLWGHDYALFKGALTPTWELNRHGGRWMVNFQKNEGHLLDACWMALSKAAVGGAFRHNGASICGLVVKVRQDVDKIGLWTVNKDDYAANQAIGVIMKRIVGGERLIYFNAHLSKRVPGRPDYMYRM